MTLEKTLKKAYEAGYTMGQLHLSDKLGIEHTTTKSNHVDFEIWLQHNDIFTPPKIPAEYTLIVSADAKKVFESAYVHVGYENNTVYSLDGFNWVNLKVKNVNIQDKNP